MRKPKTKPPEAKRRAYHHGDLRRTLLDAARDEIASNGAKSLTLVSLARRAGVAQSAPYRHFADRDELLMAVATDGFKTFTGALLAAANAGTASGALVRMHAEYVRFGENNSELYRLMFASGLVAGAAEGSELRQAAMASFQPLFDRVPDRPSKRAHIAACAIWAQLHGIVMLKADGLLTESSQELLNALGG